MDARMLRSFVVLAEELHFSRAAARLGVTQSTVSVRVRALERELGARLFERSTRRVALTDAGRRLLEEAPGTLVVLADTAEAVHASGEHVPRLRAGFSTAGRYEVTEPILERYERADHATPLSVREASSGGLLRELTEFRLEIAITFCATVPAGLHRERLRETRALASLPVDHDLAARGTITLRDLARLPLVLIEEAGSEGYNAVVLAACRDAGIEPKVAWIPRGESQEAFRRSRGLKFIPPGAQPVEPDGVATVEIDGPAPMLFYDVLWRDEADPGVREFLAAARAERDAREWLSAATADSPGPCPLR